MFWLNSEKILSEKLSETSERFEKLSRGEMTSKFIFKNRKVTCQLLLSSLEGQTSPSGPALVRK